MGVPFDIIPALQAWVSPIPVALTMVILITITCLLVKNMSAEK